MDTSQSHRSFYQTHPAQPPHLNKYEGSAAVRCQRSHILLSVSADKQDLHHRPHRPVCSRGWMAVTWRGHGTLRGLDEIGEVYAFRQEPHRLQTQTLLFILIYLVQEQNVRCRAGHTTYPAWLLGIIPGFIYSQCIFLLPAIVPYITALAPSFPGLLNSRPH